MRSRTRPGGFGPHCPLHSPKIEVAMSSPSLEPVGPPSGPAAQLPQYLASSAAWFAAFGVQQVLFTYIATKLLNLPGVWLGLAQASNTLPALAFLLLGGAVADQRDTRQMMFIAHLCACISPLGMAFVSWSGHLSYFWLMVFGILAGIVTSFMMPAREAMLARVIGSRTPSAIQRAVRYSLLAQFFAQIVGMAFARTAQIFGLTVVFCVQAALQVFGATMAWRLHSAPPIAQTQTRGFRGQLARIGEGLRDVASSPSLLPVNILTLAIGVCFVGSFLVILPVILREDFGATVERVSTMQVVFWGGTIVSTLALGMVGPILRKGRLIVFAICLGCVDLAGMAAPGPLWLFYLLTFVWGLGAGVTITMARTIVQEDAPDASRARVMSVYQLGFTGGLPLGALMAGPVVDATSGRIAAPIAAIAMACVLTGLLSFTRLWTLGGPMQTAQPG